MAITDDQEDLRNLVVQLAPDLVPDRLHPFFIYAGGGILLGYAGLLVAAGLFGGDFLTLFWTYVLVIAFVGLGLLGAHRIRRASDRDHERALSTVLDPSNGKMRSALLAGLRAVIAQKREEALGRNSEWERAHRPLLEASHEADRSLRYWEERARVEPESEIVNTHREVAARLSDKFAGAVQSLNRRSEALRVFIDQCEAKLLVLESKSRDFEETQRLTELAARADDLIEGADATLRMLGRQFVQTAHVVGNTLASLQLVHLHDLAAEVPLDRLEDVADQIVRCTDEQERAVEELTLRLSSR